MNTYTHKKEKKKKRAFSEITLPFRVKFTTHDSISHVNEPRYYCSPGDHNYRLDSSLLSQKRSTHNGRKKLLKSTEVYQRRHSVPFIRVRRLPSVFRDGRNNLLNCRRLLIIPARLNPDLEPGSLGLEWRGSIIFPLHLTITANKYR